MGTFLYPLSTTLFPLRSHHVLLKILAYFKEIFLKNNCKNIYFCEGTKSITKKQNTKFKQQGILFDQLYIHSEVSLKHIATSILVHVQLSNTFKNQIKQTNKTFNSWG